MTNYSREFLIAIPKTDLHVHLDGSLRIPTIIEIAKEQKILLPSYTEEGLRKLIFKDRYADLSEYLQGFQYTTAVMQTPEALERVAYELAIDNISEGVRYIEVRFAPQLHANASQTMEDVIETVNRGLARARNEINKRPAIACGSEPPFEYGIIGCALRMFKSDFSDYYRRLIDLHSNMSNEELHELASGDLVRALIKARDDRGLPIAGFDLAGAERGYPSEVHRQSCDLAHRHFLKKTVHAGEDYGPASIFQAITDCHADRIGHGTHIFDTDMVDLADKAERELYVHELWQYVADRRITIEVCLTSNLQTMPQLEKINDHPFSNMLAKRLSVTLCTDNRLISHTSVTGEIELAVSNFAISPPKFKDLIIYGFKRSFFPGDYMAKREYVRKIIDYYERMELEHVIKKQ